LRSDFKVSFPKLVSIAVSHLILIVNCGFKRYLILVYDDSYNKAPFSYGTDLKENGAIIDLP
jgi:hypothetical protein